MNNFRLMRFGLLAAAATTSLAAQAESKTLTLDSSGLQAMKINAGSGFLHIEGVENSQQIEVLAEIVGDREDYRLTLEKTGDTALLVSEFNHSISFRIGEWPRIELTVKVPNRLMLDITDGAGDIKLTGMKAAAKIDDGSGSLDIKNHIGKLTVEDGSGEIDIVAVIGNLRLVDHSGSLSVENIVGDVDITDGSGALRVKNIDGHVTIDDGSGGILVANIKQGLTITASGSGSLSISGVQNGVDIDD